MAVTFLEASSVFQSLSSADPADPRTFTYTLPDGTDERLIVVVFGCGAEFGCDPGDPDDYTVTYGGISLNVRGATVPDVLDPVPFGVAVLSVDGQTFASTDLVITPVGATSGNLQLKAKVYLFDGADPDTDNFTVAYVEDAELAVESLTLAGVSPQAEGDLIFSFGCASENPVANEFSFTPSSDFTQDDAFSLSTDGGEDPVFAAAYSVSAADAVAATWTYNSSPPGSVANIGALVFIVNAGCYDSEFNCECETPSPYRTLAELRVEFLCGVGYAAQASNPPPGMATLARMYLSNAQQFLWNRYKEARTERFFSWRMEPDVRYYGVADNSDCCVLPFDPLKVTWVGFEDLNRTWVQLIEGIPPEFYTRAQTSPGWPSHYEIRSCVEIFPAPQAAYTLWIKGQFGLGAFSADGDRTTMDDCAVLWYAIGQYRADRNMPSGDWKGMSLQRIKDITSGQHGTARYVPSPGGQLPPMTPPRFLPLGSEPS
jgi:hypothetical protein